MPPPEFRRAAEEITAWIADYLENPGRYPVLPDTQPGGLSASLPGAAPAHGEPMEGILADFRQQILPACTLWNHPRFFAYFSVSSSGPGILAEMLTATLNMNGMLWKSSPAVTELEQVTLGWLREWLGLPPSFFGIIHDTASLATMHAIVAARQHTDPEVRTRGARPDMTIYTSEHAHSSVEKGALALGIGQENVRKIATDDEFRMKPAELARAVEQDRAAGRRPFCVVATVGTTSTSSIDPVGPIADICEGEGMWLHVDGAYGGHAGLVPGHRHVMENVSRADSFVINPHKWLFTPIDLSAFYTRRPEALREALSLVPEYLRSSEDTVNYMDYSVALGRRFRALKLWFVMRYFGRERIAGMIGTHMRMAKELASRIGEDGRFELCAPVPLSLVCFRLRGPDEASRQLLERLHATREAFLSHTVLKGRFVLRWAIGNIHTRQSDIDATWDLISRLADEVQAP
ncbi:MAG: pyridoxal-dependent decarboxylase [Bryobacteraceae bacterium]|nr:pyridoxal-dependent decarboxylase [Bryobacteraceae bacterium]